MTVLQLDFGSGAGMPVQVFWTGTNRCSVPAILHQVLSYENV